MTLLILSDDNIATAKSILRDAYPDIRSSHLSEALAFSLGFKTNAALRAQLAADATRPPGVADAEATPFAERLAQLGYAAIETAPFTQVLTSPELPDIPIARFKRGDIRANNRHHDDCMRANRPMMMIKMARRYAELEWDCVTTSSLHEPHLRGEAATALVRTMFARCMALTKGAPGKPYFYGSAFTGSIEHLLPATAETLAGEYFKLLYLPFREAPKANLAA